MKSIYTNFKFISFVVFSLFFLSCMKEELPVQPYDRGGTITDKVVMGVNYENQIWYKLSNAKIVSSNNRTDWDIAFDCSSSNLVKLNSSIAARAVITNTTNFNTTFSTSAYTFKPDHPNGNKDSLALGDCFSHGKVCLIDRGFGISGNSLGIIKIQFLEANGNVLKFRYANLDGQNEKNIQISKNPAFNYLAFSFNTGNSLTIEPEKESYDLCFTTYTHIFYDPYNPYLVNGVLINSFGVEVAEVFNKSFSEISRNDIEAYQFSNYSDIIGYDWKEYNINQGTFIIFPEKNYLIKDSEGFYYKLHFIDFFDENGKKGCPTFEFQKL